MKFLSCICVLAGLFFGCSVHHTNTVSQINQALKDSAAVAGNPIIRHKFIADPPATVYNGTVYLYAGHDEAPERRNGYVMHEWLLFSSTDMVNWKEHPVPLKVKDFFWANEE